MNTKLLCATSLAMGLFAAGCQSTPNFGGFNTKPKPAPAVVPKVENISGSWIPTDAAAKGVYVATFQDGSFISKSPKDGKILAKGTYTLTEKNVALKFVGAATGTAVDASCDRKTATTLYCVPTVGSPFNLQKAS